MKKLLIIIVQTPAVQTKDKNDVTIRSKSSAGSAFSDNWDATFGKKDQQSPTLN